MTPKLSADLELAPALWISMRPKMKNFKAPGEQKPRQAAFSLPIVNTIPPLNPDATFLDVFRPAFAGEVSWE
jgi:hypothetical protein